MIVRVLFLPLALLLAGFLCMGWLGMRAFQRRSHAS